MKKVNGIIDKNVCKELREELIALFAKFEKKGLKIEVGNMNFTANDIKIKLLANRIGNGGVVLSREAEDYNMLKDSHKLAFDIGQELKDPDLGGVRILGYKTRAPKNPIIFEQISTGKCFKAPVSYFTQLVTA